jgi:cell division protein FtsZ
MEVSALIQGKVDEDAKVVLGVLYDESLGDELRVTVIATGIGNVVRKNEPISLLEESRKAVKMPAMQEAPAAPAPANPRPPFVTPLLQSNFEDFGNLGVSSRKEGMRTQKDSRSFNEDYLETPTYLRKKAN